MSGVPTVPCGVVVSGLEVGESVSGVGVSGTGDVVDGVGVSELDGVAESAAIIIACSSVDVISDAEASCASVIVK